MSRWWIVMVAATLAGLEVFAHAGAFEDGDASDMARSRIAGDAEQAYLEGIDGIAGSSEAQAAFGRSADLWRMLVEDGVEDPAVWFNLGNAELRAGRVGEAILAYRRAQRLAPTDDDIAANLAVARSKVARPVEADANDLDFGDAAAGWRILPMAARWWIGVVAWIGFWGLLLARRTIASVREDESESRTAFWRGGLLACGVVAIACVATVGIDLAAPGWRPVGVIVENEVVVRSGNGEGFEAAIEEPITAGVEFRILEDRPGWWRIELPDGSQGWIPTGTGSRV